MAVVTSITTQGGETTVSTSSERKGDLVADRRLYLDKDGMPVEAGDTARAELLVAAGLPIPQETVERLGLRMEQGRLAWGAPPPEEKPAVAAQEAPQEPSGNVDASQGVQAKPKAVERTKRNG